MTMRGTACTLVLLASLGSPPAGAAPVAALDVPALAAEAAAVATGRVTAARAELLPGRAPHEVLTLTVDRWLKSPGGTTPRTVTVPLPVALPGVAEGKCGTFYLAVDPV